MNYKHTMQEIEGLPNRLSCPVIDKLGEYEHVEERNDKILDPQQMKLFTEQAGGHSKFYKIGDKIAKPCNPNEFIIYEALKGNPIASFTPKYYGLLANDRLYESTDTIRKFQVGGKYIVLEDLTDGYSNPSVMDLKMGIKLYHSDSSEDDILKRKIKANGTTSGSFGFRLEGFRVYRPKMNNYLLREDTWGKILNSKTLINAFQTFFSDGFRVRTEVIFPLIQRLEELLKVLKENPKFNFLASSVLIIYEGDYNLGPVKVDARIIDFDHATLSDVDDAGVAFGISNMIVLLKKLHYFNNKLSHTETDIRIHAHEDVAISTGRDDNLFQAIHYSW